MSTFVLLSFLACVTRDNYFDKLATVSCRKAKQCEPEEFAQLFETVNQCEGFYGTFLNLFVGDECLEDCDFDSAKASTCLSSARGTSCKEFSDDDFEGDPACEEVYDCDDAELSDECLGVGDTGL